MLDQRDLIDAVPPVGAPAFRERADVLMRAEGVDIGYGGPVAVGGLSFEVAAGERVGVLGPNGAGKTTLFRAVWGELTPVAGTLTAPARVGVVAQTERSRLDYPVSALDVALMGTLSTVPWWRRPGRPHRERALGALRTVGMGDLAHVTFGALSGGQRQRVLIARALMQEARVVLLDEPYSGLDTTSAARLDGLLSELAASGCALLIATHDVGQARGWEKVLCLNRAQIAFGPPASTLTEVTLARTYGTYGTPL